MKKFRCLLALALIVMLLGSFAPNSLADSPVGSWSGTMSAAGMKFGGSATFSANGSCSISAGGYSGSGSWSGGSISFNSSGKHVNLSYSQKGNRMTIRGHYSGVSGTLSLSRRTTGAAAVSTPKPVSIYRTWMADWNDAYYFIKLYEDGWMLWTEIIVGEQPVDYAARISVEADRLFVQPLYPDAEQPELWADSYDENLKIYVFPYEQDHEYSTLALTLGNEKMTFDSDKALDKKPTEEVFYPFVTLKRGDRGDAVKALQQLLVDTGHMQPPADGIFGRGTERAVQSRQTQLGLEPTGTATVQELTGIQ